MNLKRKWMKEVMAIILICLMPCDGVYVKKSQNYCMHWSNINYICMIKNTVNFILTSLRSLSWSSLLGLVLFGSVVVDRVLTVTSGSIVMVAAH